MAGLGKTEAIAEACVYKIATGVWLAGTRLPSLRQAAGAWSVDQLTVQRAYRRLVELGLVRSLAKSGYYVEDTCHVSRLAMQIPTLERLYTDVADQIRRRTGLTVLGALRLLVQLGEEKSAAAPEFAFAECTEFQARQIASRIAQQLGVPCAPMVIDNIRRNPHAVPGHVRVLMTTAFHYGEIVGVDFPGTKTIAQITVRFCGGVVERLVAIGSDIRLFCLDPKQGLYVAEEIRGLAGGAELQIQVEEGAPEQIEKTLHACLKHPATPDAGRAVVLSPTLWSAAPQAWRECKSVLPYEYDVTDSSLADVAAAAGLPPSVRTSAIAAPSRMPGA